MALDRVQPLKLESPESGGTETDDFPTSMDRNEDYVDCRGVVFQNDSSDDETVYSSRDVSGNMTFTDVVSGTKTLAQLLDTLWADDLTNLKPQTDGRGIRLYHVSGVQSAILQRGSGNFSISVLGTDARALYCNAMIGQWQLGGSTTSQYWNVVNSGDAEIVKCFGDRTSRFCGKVRFRNGDITTDYLDVQHTGSIAKYTAASLAHSSWAHEFIGGDVAINAASLVRTTTGQNIGTTSAEWNMMFASQFRVTNGLAQTKLTSGQLSTLNGLLTLNGGFGLEFKSSGVLGNSTSKFVGNAATRYNTIYAYYGTGIGTTAAVMYHNGTDAYFGTHYRNGLIRLLGSSGVVPIRKDDDAAAISGSVWYDEDVENAFRGRKNGRNLNFAMEYPPSATDPTSPTPQDGDTYYNTALGAVLQYDGTRAKWLTNYISLLQVGSNGLVLAGAYYKGINGMVLSDVLGYTAFTNGTVVGLSYTRGASTAATFEVVANGSPIAELASAATSGKASNLNGDFSAGGILAVRNKAGSSTTSTVQVWVAVKWRA